MRPKKALNGDLDLTEGSKRDGLKELHQNLRVCATKRFHHSMNAGDWVV